MKKDLLQNNVPRAGILQQNSCQFKMIVLFKFFSLNGPRLELQHISNVLCVCVCGGGGGCWFFFFNSVFFLRSDGGAGK